MGGVKQYIEAMCRAMIDQISKTDELHIFHNRNTPYFNTKQENVFEVLMKSRNRLKCDLIDAPKAINDRNLDVVWFTKYVVPFGITAKTVTTVHDLAYYIPDLGAYTLGDTLYMRVMIRNSCRRADHIVAVSEHTKSDIVNRLGVSADKITVIYEAADRRYHRPVDKDHVALFREKNKLPDHFILFTGGISPRKNLIRLIKAYRTARIQIPHRLVLTGGKGWRNKAVLKAIENSPDIIRLGFVPDDKMPLLYAAADLFVYPTLYEGFGLPILEAQACGTPVVCSNNSSLPEVAGDGVRFILPSDVENIASTIVEVLTDVRMRRALSEKGRVNTARFSWNRAAGDLLKLLTK
ncbi:MAG: glycosyltransferase family 1 protein [Planctomycetia bacterium]|jgi:glycosyltransferase involved in cell wall biosynthesis